MTTLEVVVAKHEEKLGQMEDRVEHIEAKLDRLYLWLIGVLGGVVASLGLLLSNVRR